MNVGELKALLAEHPDSTEVLLSIVMPAESDDDDDIVTDLYTIEASLVYPDDETGEDALWLVGGEEDDVDRLMAEVEVEGEGEEEHDHAD